MNCATYEERMAVRIASQMASAQAAYDNAAEAEPQMLDDYSAGDLQERIRIAEELIGKAERCIAAGNLAAGSDYMNSAAAELRGE